MNNEQDKHQLLAATDLDALYPVLNDNRMTAGWYKKRPSLWPQPRTLFRPRQWSYQVGALALDQAGRWMDTELAERRNLLLFNPVEDNDYDTVRTLVAAYQMVKPGEHARAHRHSPSALRMVVDSGPGCYTVVDGVKLPMGRGDILLTPGNSWHSHYNEGEQNAYWIDFLDVPLVHRLEPMFVEHLPGGRQPETSSPAAHPFFFSAEWIRTNLAGADAGTGTASLRLPTSEPMRTIGITCHRIAAGSTITTVADTASRIFAIGEGSGSVDIAGEVFTWERGDVMAVPGWHPFAFAARESAVVVEVSDEPAMRALGLYRQKVPA